MFDWVLNTYLQLLPNTGKRRNTGKRNGQNGKNGQNKLAHFPTFFMVDVEDIDTYSICFHTPIKYFY